MDEGMLLTNLSLDRAIYSVSEASCFLSLTLRIPSKGKACSRVLVFSGLQSYQLSGHTYIPQVRSTSTLCVGCAVLRF